MSVRIFRRIGLVFAVLLAFSAAGTAAQAATLTYYGGPVSHSMNVILVKWGSLVRSTYTDPTSGDPGFFSYLASQSGSPADIGGVLAQYMDTTGHNSQNAFTYGGMDQISPSVGANPSSTNQETVQDSDIQSALASAISSTTLPTPPGNGLSTIYVVLFPPNDNVCSGGSCAYDANGFCAYHGSFPLNGSTHVLYAAMVDNGPNTPNFGFCGPSSNDVSNQTDVVSHEFAETINDPLVAEAANWGPPLAWYNQSQGEIGDICTGSTELASNGPWAVQKIWSNRDSKCVAAESAFSAPTAAFLAPTVGAPSQSLSFDASASSDPSSNTDSAFYSGLTYSLASGITGYQWDWGDGSTSGPSSTATASHTYANTGTYNVTLTVTDRLGFTSTITHQVAVSSDGTLAPAVTTGSPTGVSDQGATLNGTVNPENQSVQYQFIYGTAQDQLTSSTGWTTGPTGSSPSAVSATIGSLQASTPYYYELEVQAGGQTYPGSVQSFTTNAVPPPVQTPVVATTAATALTTSGATLNGTINPDGSGSVTYWFTYGTSSGSLNQATTHTTLTGGLTAVPVSAGVTRLSSGRTYYYQLNVSFNGSSYPGGVQHFTTLFPPPTVSTGGASSITSTSATISGTVNPHGAPTTYWVEYGPTSTYGFSTGPVSAGSGTSNLTVHVPLGGLSANTPYFYALVASNGVQTVVGTGRSFKTRSTGKTTRLGFGVRAPRNVHDALTQGLQVRFQCTDTCYAYFTVDVVPAGQVGRDGSVPITVTRKWAAAGSSTPATTTLSFSPEDQSRLGSAHSLELIVSGAALTGPDGEPSPDVTQRIFLH